MLARPSTLLAQRHSSSQQDKGVKDGVCAHRRWPQKCRKGNPEARGSKTIGQFANEGVGVWVGVGGTGGGCCLSRQGWRTRYGSVVSHCPHVITARSAYGSSCRALCFLTGKYARNNKRAINSDYCSFSEGPASNTTSTCY